MTDTTFNRVWAKFFAEDGVAVTAVAQDAIEASRGFPNAGDRVTERPDLEFDIDPLIAGFMSKPGR